MIMRHEGDNNNDDGNTPLQSRASRETVGGDPIIASDDYLKAEKGRPFIRHRPHEDDTISVETNQLRRAGQIELIAPIYGRFRDDD
jgi:hypothetical protein